MMNSIFLIGRLVYAVELSHTQNGTVFLRNVVAVERNYVSSAGERKPDFIPIVLWKGTAEFVGRNFRKGDMIALRGTLHINEYTDQEGNQKISPQVVVSEISFCGSKKSSGSAESKEKPRGKETPPTEMPVEDLSLFNDDDLPF